MQLLAANYPQDFEFRRMQEIIICYFSTEA